MFSTHSTGLVGGQRLPAPPAYCSLWRSIRTPSVSDGPQAADNQLVWKWQSPKSRRPSVRARMIRGRRPVPNWPRRRRCRDSRIGSVAPEICLTRAPLSNRSAVDSMTPTDRDGRRHDLWSRNSFTISAPELDRMSAHEWRRKGFGRYSSGILASCRAICATPGISSPSSPGLHGLAHDHHNTRSRLDGGADSSSIARCLTKVVVMRKRGSVRARI